MHTSPKSIALPSLVNGLRYITSNFSYSNYDILFPIFTSTYSKVEILINDILSSGKSDILLCYGNNNFVLREFMDHILLSKSNLNQLHYFPICLNGYIHTSEDFILKQLCERFDIQSERVGFENYQRALERYLKTKDYAREARESLIVVYYENFEHLMMKKKQVLLYTLMELINNSRNIVLVGFTLNYNLIDRMEKRIKSRFSQKTFCIPMPNIDSVVNGLEKMIVYNKMNNTSIDIPSSLELFFECLVSEETREFLFLIRKYIYNGLGIVEILTKIKYILILVLNDLSVLAQKDNMSFILMEQTANIINKHVGELVEDESQGSYYNLLKNFPKLHITFLICLCHCTADYKEKITIGMIYKKYYESIYSPNVGKTQKSKLDLTLVKKYLEELANSNLLVIKKDEKYDNVYELKLPLRETVKIIKSLDAKNKLDEDMTRILDTIKC